jgi:hypothetical protein
MKRAAGAIALAVSLASVAHAKEPTKMAVTGADVVLVAPGHYQFAALSKQTSSTASLGVVEDDALDAGVALLNLTVSNTGHGLVGLSPDEVQVTTDDGKPVAMLTYTQMAELTHKALGGKRFGTGLGNFVVALAAANAGTHQSETSFDGSVNSTFHGQVGTFSGTSTTTTYDPAERARAEARAQAYIAANNAKLKAAQDSLDAQARGMSFASAAIPPGEWKATLIPLEKLPAKAKGLSVTVKLGDDVHVFQISLSGAVRGWTVASVPPPIAMTKEAVNAWLSDHVDQTGWALANIDRTSAYFVSLKPEPAVSTFPRVAVKREYYQPAYALGLGVLSERTVWEVDCSAHRVRMVALESHPSNSLKDIMIRQDRPDDPWGQLTPGSLLDKFGMTVCPGPAPSAQATTPVG